MTVLDIIGLGIVAWFVLLVVVIALMDRSGRRAEEHARAFEQRRYYRGPG